MKPLISVIVPVYKVKPYLSQCIDSILRQTYLNLEIILVDDGSPDDCGIICDRYAIKDKRIKVFHKQNGGLSDARNYGIALSTGDYLGFVDSDDWIEPDMFEVLVNAVEENEADLAICSCFCEYSERTVVKTFIDKKFLNICDLVKALLLGDINNGVWNKLYRKSCFFNLMFPKGHVYEDVATTHKLFLQAETGVTLSKPLYHYRMNRIGSITQVRSLDNLIDYWLAHKLRYDYFLADSRFNTDNKILDRLRFKCAVAVAKTWRWCYGNSEQKIEKYSSFLEEMKNFARNDLTYVAMKGWPFHLQLTVILARFNYKFVFALLYYLNQAYRKMRG